MKYTIICLTNTTQENVELVTQCYRVWKDVYGPILKASHEELTPDLFYRCKLLSVLTEEGSSEPIAFCLHNNFNTQFEDLGEHSYFAPATPEFMSMITGRREHMMTLEWVTVHPNQRGKFTKIQPVDLIMGLAAKLGQHSPWTAMMGFSRVDLKADRVAEKSGFRSYGEVTRHDITCRIMYCPMDAVTPHPFPKVQALIDDLWLRRENTSLWVKNDKAHRSSDSQEVAA